MIPGVVASSIGIGPAEPVVDPFVGWPKFSERQVSLVPLTTYSFDIECVAGKHMVIFTWGQNASTWRFFNSVTLDGVDIVPLRGAEALGSTSLYLTYFELEPDDLPGDGRFTLALEWDGAQDRCGVAVFIGDDTTFSGAWDIEEVFPQEDVNNEATTFVGGGAVAFLVSTGGPTTYTNITEVFDEVVTGGLYQSGATGDTSAAPTTTFVITTAGATGETAGLLLTYKP